MSQEEGAGPAAWCIFAQVNAGDDETPLFYELEERDAAGVLQFRGVFKSRGAAEAAMRELIAGATYYDAKGRPTVEGDYYAASAPPEGPTMSTGTSRVAAPETAGLI